LFLVEIDNVMKLDRLRFDNEKNNIVSPK
jgi:hypothetical protein